jgi:hypothetical protein
LGFVIVVDGPNFINELERNGKDKNYVMKTLSFHILHGVIQNRLNQHGLRGHPFLHTYFVCSDKKQMGDFKDEEKQVLLTKLKCETGLTVDEILQSHKEGKEHEVDMHVFIRMLEMGPLARPYHDEWRHIVLVSRDSDFVPAIRLLSQMGTHTIVMGFDSKESPFPMELKNESYLFLELSEILGEMEKIEEQDSRIKR